MKIPRRDFLKAALAAVAGSVLPKVKNVAHLKSDQCGWDGEECSLATCPFSIEENKRACAYFGVWILDVHLSDDNTPWSRELARFEKQQAVQQALFDSCECAPMEIEPGAQVYVTRDKGEAWESLGEYDPEKPYLIPRLRDADT